MDLESAITGAILVVICIVPFVLMRRNRKKRERQLLQSLTNIANQHNCRISQHEICMDFGIGIDETESFVVFFKQTKDKVVEEFINLAEIQKCKINNITRTIIDKEGRNNIIDKLELNFIPNTPNKREVTFEFFNADVYPQLYGELKSIQNWSKLINERLKAKN